MNTQHWVNTNLELLKSAGLVWRDLACADPVQPFARVSPKRGRDDFIRFRGLIFKIGLRARKRLLQSICLFSTSGGGFYLIEEQTHCESFQRYSQ